MTKQTLYSCKAEINSDGHTDYRISKFVDGDLESSYLTTLTECECPAGHRPSCRHRQMLPMMLAHGMVNTHWFWDFDLNRVVDFSGELKSNLDALNELAVGRDRTATEIEATPLPPMADPITEYIVDRIRAALPEGPPTEPQAAETPEQAREAMAKCDYWNGRKSLSEPDATDAVGTTLAERAEIEREMRAAEHHVALAKGNWRRI